MQSHRAERLDTGDDQESRHMEPEARERQESHQTSLESMLATARFRGRTGRFCTIQTLIEWASAWTA
jgi:hypothetical protein